VLATILFTDIVDATPHAAQIGDRAWCDLITSHHSIVRRELDRFGDGASTAWKDLSTILDNLIQQRRLPPMVAVLIGNGGQDAQGPRMMVRSWVLDWVRSTYADRRAGTMKVPP
jgi:class 3 adenylate cyclase